MAPSDDSNESVATPDDPRDLLDEGLVEPAPGDDGADSVVAQARRARPQRKAVGSATTAGKGTATPARKRSAQAAVDRPTGPVQFVGEAVDELKKVVWPTWIQVQQYFWAVLVFVLIVITYVGLLDLGFGWVMLKLFGG